MHVSTKVQDLLKRGTIICNPASVYVDASVNSNLIAPGVVIHPGCRITGNTTSIGPRSIIGEEGPVTIIDCQLAENVTLKGGSFSGTIMLAGSTFGPCAHVRKPTILEEQASCAHAVGLKQTILFPFVTLGSQINFCDCLMAGGTDRKNHSEIGSSYVHFNYTPRQDKATASLIGDVPRGVMLDQRPIFLGGQGGLVGPRRIEYGSVVAAGTICRRDITRQDKLIFGSTTRLPCEFDYKPLHNEDISQILLNNFTYLGNLHALYCWYKYVRRLFITTNQFDRACYKGTLLALNTMLAERVQRLSELVNNLINSLENAKKKYGKKLPAHPFAHYQQFIKKWPKITLTLEYNSSSNIAMRQRNNFLTNLDEKIKSSYLETIKNLSLKEKKIGTLWLQSVVDSIVALYIS
jgi:UDP-N-acetylglucosamine/UDP-N-acetylgalactosamine diphosphorylase